MKSSLAVLFPCVLHVLGVFQSPGSSDSLSSNPVKPAPLPATLFEIEEKCAKVCFSFRSITAQMRIVTLVSIPGGVMETEGKGTYEERREGEKIMFRSELTNEIKAEINGRRNQGTQKVLTISDGRFGYVLTLGPGDRRQAVKTMAPKASQALLADNEFFGRLRTKYQTTILPDEKVDEKDVWVVEARPIAAAPGEPAKITHYILKDCAVRVRTTGHDAQGRRVQFTGLSEIKLNVEVDPRRMVFDLPKGVELIDMTGGGK